MLFLIFLPTPHRRPGRWIIFLSFLGFSCAERWNFFPEDPKGIYHIFPTKIVGSVVRISNFLNLMHDDLGRKKEGEQADGPNSGPIGTCTGHVPAPSLSVLLEIRCAANDLTRRRQLDRPLFPTKTPTHRRSPRQTLCLGGNGIQTF